MIEHDLYMTPDMEDILDTLQGEQDLSEMLQAVAQPHSVIVSKCYIRCNTRQDPPLGDMILRVGMEGSTEGKIGFMSDLLHLLRTSDVTDC